LENLSVLTGDKMATVSIELEFDSDEPSNADVINYLNELIENDMLNYEVNDLLKYEVKAKEDGAFAMDSSEVEMLKEQLRKFSPPQENDNE